MACDEEQPGEDANEGANEVGVFSCVFVAVPVTMTIAVVIVMVSFVLVTVVRVRIFVPVMVLVIMGLGHLMAVAMVVPRAHLDDTRREQAGDSEPQQ